MWQNYFSDTTIIKSVTGSEYFEEDNCNAKQKEAVNDLSNILEGNYEVDRFEKRGEIGVHLNQVSFELDSGGSIIIKCYDNVDKAKNRLEKVKGVALTYLGEYKSADTEISKKVRFSKKFAGFLQKHHNL